MLLAVEVCEICIGCNYVVRLSLWAICISCPCPKPVCLQNETSLGCLNGSKNNFNTIYGSIIGIWTNKGFYMYKLIKLLVCLICFVAKDTHSDFVMEAFTCKSHWTVVHNISALRFGMTDNYKWLFCTMQPFLLLYEAGSNQWHNL